MRPAYNAFTKLEQMSAVMFLPAILTAFFLGGARLWATHRGRRELRGWINVATDLTLYLTDASPSLWRLLTAHADVVAQVGFLRLDGCSDRTVLMRALQLGVYWLAIG
eukprot:scaffold679594_cov125-Prasinocladus_malaysianus.AAC.1